MKIPIGRYFAIPATPGDPDRTQRARLFNLCHWLCTAWLLMTVVGNILGGAIPHEVSIVMLGVVALGTVPFFLVRAGRLEVGVTIWILYAFVAATLGLAMLGTIRAPSLGFYLVLVICSGMVFGARALIATALASSAAVAGLIVAENSGWLPVPDYRVSVTQWITASAFFACVGGLTYLATRQVRDALARAQSEVAERRKAEEALRQANRELQEALVSVKALKGLLPMCAWCRKVREDQGYWSELENYVAAHTDTTFTHGICPDCRNRHFPNRRCEKVE